VYGKNEYFYIRVVQGLKEISGILAFPYINIKLVSGI